MRAQVLTWSLCRFHRLQFAYVLNVEGYRWDKESNCPFLGYLFVKHYVPYIRTLPPLSSSHSYLAPLFSTVFSLAWTDVRASAAIESWFDETGNGRTVAATVDAGKPVLLLESIWLFLFYHCCFLLFVSVWCSLGNWRKEKYSRICIYQGVCGVYIYTVIYLSLCVPPRAMLMTD